MLTHHSNLKRRTRLRPISAKRTHWGRIYATKRSRFLGAHPVCQRCDDRRATDIHHNAGRIGEKLNDTADWMAVCRCCHETIHREPSLARVKGWLK